MIRDLELRDLMKVEKLHYNDFPLPDVNDPSYFLQLALVLNNEVIGAAFARYTSEVSLIIDPSVNGISRACLFKDVVKELLKTAREKHVKSTHIFITPENDTRYADFLIKYLGFVKATGIPLYLEVK